MSTPAEQDERAVSHRIAWADASRVYARRPLVTQAVLLTVIFVLAVLDAYLMMPALQSVLRLPVETTEKIAYGISAASALALYASCCPGSPAVSVHRSTRRGASRRARCESEASETGTMARAPARQPPAGRMKGETRRRPLPCTGAGRAQNARPAARPRRTAAAWEGTVHSRRARRTPSALPRTCPTVRCR